MAIIKSEFMEIVKFGDLNVGDVFVLPDRAFACSYIKTEKAANRFGNEVNAVDLTYGTHIQFSRDKKVIEINEVVIK